MSTAKSRTDARDPACRSMGRLLGAHVDGQLDTVNTIQVEDHLSACEICRERIALDRAIRGSLKKAVNTTAPDAVRARLLAAMAGERAREDKRDQDADLGANALSNALSSAPSSSGASKAGSRPAMLRHWRTMLPLASAAALALAWGFAGDQPLARGTNDCAHAGFGNEDLLNQFASVHGRPLRPETADPKEVRAFERDVGVPVRVPQFQQKAKFVGGRLLPVQGGERAAMLQYEINEGSNVKRVSVFIYDPRRVQIGNPNLAPRAVGTAQIQVGQAGGYSVAVAQHRGVGYAVASELDPESSARLAADAEGE